MASLSGSPSYWKKLFPHLTRARGEAPIVFLGKIATWIFWIGKISMCWALGVGFSPPVRWGLLDFMSALDLLPPPPPPPPSPPQLRSCEFSVACWTPTAILWVQCGVLDPNRDPASAVWRAGPQLRSCEFSVAGRTPTVISWVQCCVPDLNCDSASSVWRAGPQLRLCEFSVACRTSPVMERIGSSCRKSVSKK